MTKFSEVETRLRRFLKDPNADIWSQQLLIDLFNQAQEEFNDSTRILEKICSIRIPSQYDFSMVYEWEEEFTDGKASGLMCQFVAAQYMSTQEWEIDAWVGQLPVIAGGYRATQPWERYSVSVVVHGKSVFKFPEDYKTCSMLIWNRYRLKPITEESAMRSSRNYETRAGWPRYYYTIGRDQDREFVIYPLPSEIVWYEPETGAPDVDCGYSAAWESDYPTPESKSYARFTSITEDDGICVYAWELYFLDNGNSNPDSTYDFGGYYATNNYDTKVVPYSIGMVISVDPDTDPGEAETGSIWGWKEAYTAEDEGIAVDYMDLDYQLLCIYKPKATKVLIPSDDIENWLDWQIKYIERLTVALAYKVNNDGYNPDMSAFWEYRYRDGLGVIQKFKSKQQTGRRPRLKGSGNRRWQTELVDLPDTFESLHK